MYMYMRRGKEVVGSTLDHGTVDSGEEGVWGWERERKERERERNGKKNM